MILCSQTIQDFTVNFEKTGLSSAVRLTVNQVDLGAITNAVLTEVIVMSKTSYNFCFDRESPNLLFNEFSTLKSLYRAGTYLN